jgi:hypothetical protein
MPIAGLHRFRSNVLGAAGPDPKQDLKDRSTLNGAVRIRAEALAPEWEDPKEVVILAV